MLSCLPGQPLSSFGKDPGTILVCIDLREFCAHQQNVRRVVDPHEQHDFDGCKHDQSECARPVVPLVEEPAAVEQDVHRPQHERDPDEQGDEDGRRPDDRDTGEQRQRPAGEPGEREADDGQHRCPAPDHAARTGRHAEDDGERPGDATGSAGGGRSEAGGPRRHHAGEGHRAALPHEREVHADEEGGGADPDHVAGVQEQMTWLLSGIGASDTSYTVQHGSRVSMGTMEIEDELILVSDTAGGDVATFPDGRGHEGTIASAHPANSRVISNPAFPRIRIFRDILRTLEQVREFSEAITRFLLAQGAKLIVVACNTASAAALHALRWTFPEVSFVGMEPAVKPAAAAASFSETGEPSGASWRRRQMSAAEAEGYAKAARFDFSWSGLARYWRKRD